MVDGTRSFLGKGIVRGNAAILTSYRRCHLAPCFPSDYIPGGKDVGWVGSQMFIDFNFPTPANRYPCLLYGDVVGVGTPACRDEQFLGPEFLRVISYKDSCYHMALLIDRTHRSLGYDANAFLLEDSANSPAGSRLVAVSQ